MTTFFLLFHFLQTKNAFAWPEGCLEELGIAFVQSMPGTKTDSSLSRNSLKATGVAIRFDARDLDLIDSYGFLNQSISNSTRGTMSGVSGRDEFETTAIGLYAHPALRPRYGILEFSHPNGGTIDHSKNSRHYGTAKLHFDLRKIGLRTSYSIGDSLDQWNKSQRKKNPKDIIHPLSDLSRLEEFIHGDESIDDYIEAQIWGSLTLNDATAIEFTEEPMPKDEEKAIELAKKYGLKVSKPGKTFDFSDQKKFHPMSELDVNSLLENLRDLKKKRKTNFFLHNAVLRAEYLFYLGSGKLKDQTLKEKELKLVSHRLDEQRGFLIHSLFEPRTVSAALQCLISENEPWLEDSTMKPLHQIFQNQTLVEQIRSKFPDPDMLIGKLQKTLKPGVKSDLSFIRAAYNKKTPDLNKECHSPSTPRVNLPKIQVSP